MGYDAVLAQLWKDAVHTGVHYIVVANNKVIAGLAHYPVTLVMGNVKVLHGDAIAGVQHRVVAQTLALEHRVPALFDNA